MAVFDQQVIDISSQQTPSTLAFMELDQYFKAPIIPRQEDPLQWWRNNKHICGIAGENRPSGAKTQKLVIYTML